MGNEVYANNRELACKGGQGKSIAAFPDVCFTPPLTPATPPGVPIPYPNTAMAGDTTDGSKSVKISGQEVMLKDKSYFKQNVGNQAGAAPKKGMITSINQGKAYFNAWSMDVKIESENVVRHFDLTTHNHASQTGQTPPWPYADGMAIANIAECSKEKEEISKKCTGKNKKDCPKKKKDYKTNDCVKARRCMLVPYKPKSGCCPAQTGHHLVPKHHFKGRKGYNPNKAPCICAEGWSWHRNDKSGFAKKDKTHPDLHDVQDYLEREAIDQGGKMTYADARNNGVAAHGATFPDAGCNPDCIAKQLDAYHKDEAGINDGEPVLLTARSKDAILAGEGAADRIAKAKEILKAVAEKAKQTGEAATAVTF